MKKLEEIKNEVAKEHGYTSSIDVFEFTYALCDEVAKRYATEAIKSDRERVKRAIRYPLGFIDGKIANEEIIDNLPMEL